MWLSNARCGVCALCCALQGRQGSRGRGRRGVGRGRGGRGQGEGEALEAGALRGQARPAGGRRAQRRQRRVQRHVQRATLALTARRQLLQHTHHINTPAKSISICKPILLENNNPTYLLKSFYIILLIGLYRLLLERLQYRNNITLMNDKTQYLLNNCRW